VGVLLSTNPSLPRASATMHHVTSGILYGSSRNGPLLGSGDPIAAAIGLLRPDIVVEPSLRASGEWSVRFDTFPHVKVGGVMRGGCRLSLDGHDPVRLEEGDLFLLTGPPTHVLESTPGGEETVLCTG